MDGYKTGIEFDEIQFLCENYIKALSTTTATKKKSLAN